MSANIKLNQVADVTVLEVSGRITLGEGGVTLRDSIQNALRTGTRKLVIDLGAVSYMDSSGLGEMTSAYCSAKKNGCVVKLARLTAKLDDLMQITKLATIFDIYPDTNEAVVSYCNYRRAVA